MDGGVQVRSYMTKTSKSKMDQERLGWSAWSTLTELDPQRVSRLWSAVGLPIANPEKACVARALRVWIARMLPVWSEHGAGFAGISCLARSCFTHKAMVQSGRLMLASVDLIAAQIRNFHNDLHRNPVPGVPLCSVRWERRSTARISPPVSFVTASSLAFSTSTRSRDVST